MAHLEVISGPQVGRRYALAPGANRIGRDEACEVALLDETASRRHASIELDGGVTVRDLGSANGIVVNGQKVEQRPLVDGDRIRIGQTVLQLVSGRERDTVVIGGDRPLTAVARREPGGAPDRRRPGEHEERYVRRLQSICRVAHELSDRQGADELLHSAARALAAEITFDRGAIELTGERTLAFDGEGRVKRRPIRLSRTLTDPVRSAGESLRFVAGDDPETAGRRSVARAGTACALCVPLTVGGRLLGLVYLDRLAGDGFTDEDLELATDLADRIGPPLDQLLALAGRDAALGAAGLIAVDPRMQAVVSTIERAAESTAAVLLLGETGAGKEVLARHLHASSERSDRPFVPLNMAALPHSLVESELFGHEAGAFTGAVRSQPGTFRLADGGTLFLDEIGELPLELQAKLLRALETGEFYPVGASESVTVDVRIVAATNAELKAAAAEGRFRQDLYYRLAVVEVAIPPLRERPGDVLPLARHFVQSLARRLDREPPALDVSFTDALARHPWPGNVRELRNVIERVLVLGGAGPLTAADLPPELSGADAPPDAQRPVLTLKEAEREAIVRALAFTGGKKGEAVKLLGTSWPTLNKKIKDYGITL